MKQKGKREQPAADSAGKHHETKHTKSIKVITLH
jgi:hypothetical protein